MVTVAYISSVPFSNHVTEKIENHESLKLVGYIECNEVMDWTVEQMKPDIILMDIEGLPITESTEMVQRIKAIIPDVKLITFVNHLQSDCYFQIIEAGSDSIIEKHSDDANDLIRTIFHVQQNYFILPTPITQKFVEKLEELRHDNFDFFNKRLIEHGVHLSVKEAEVAYHLKQNLRNGEIADKLKITEGTVKVHISKIYKKINIKGRKNVVKYLDRIMSNKWKSVEV
ncbi:transcriptional regulator [Oceanobacillus saliphilus]|uniref:transcriptional regulator n=1 Tax=Oceanobacillus saliphilus TaxID=2925834 RepID=UPI00201E18F0|nr:response regulator transcription factor [Oceanobacillus saliphilus]